jgi:3-methylcrotonyl-CoA carboxylase alpha subunit
VLFVLPVDAHSPWRALEGTRLNHTASQTFTFTGTTAEHPITVDVEYLGAQQYSLSINGGAKISVSGRQGDQHNIEAMIGDHSFTCAAVRIGDSVHVFHEGTHTTLDIPVPSYAATALAKGSLLAPMPGKVVKVFVDEGKKVAKGDVLMVMEAMKMEHSIRATADSVIKSVHYEVGQLVDLNAVLITAEEQ